MDDLGILEIEVRTGLVRGLDDGDFSRAKKPLDSLRVHYESSKDDEKFGVVRGVIDAIKAIGYCNMQSSSEDYLHGASEAAGMYREEELQELARASTAPSQAQLDEKRANAEKVIRDYLG